MQERGFPARGTIELKRCTQDSRERACLRTILIVTVRDTCAASVAFSEFAFWQSVPPVSSGQPPAHSTQRRKGAKVVNCRGHSVAVGRNQKFSFKRISWGQPPLVARHGARFETQRTRRPQSTMLKDASAGSASSVVQGSGKRHS